MRTLTPLPEFSTSWLLDPHVRYYFSDFPLPLAFLRDDGGVLAMNTRFAECFDAACLKAEGVRQLVRSPKAGWESLSLAGRHGGTVPVRARAMRMDSDVLLLVSAANSEKETDAEFAKLQQRIAQLETLVSTDCLTGAWNRSHLDHMIELELNRSLRYRYPLSLMLLDVDHFKRINDTHGHPVGDAVLRDLVRVMKAGVRGADMVFRWGGEEFVVVTPSTPYAAAAKLAEKIRAGIEAHEFPVVGRITVSIGVAELLPGEGAPELFKRIDDQLNAAKNGGRNRVAVDAHGCSDSWASGMLVQLQWSESYECGEPVIDNQHRRLFDLANRLIGVVLAPDPGDGSLDFALDELLDHIEQHFGDEEAILARRGYSRLKEHQALHAALLKRMARLRQAAAGARLSIGTLVDFVVNDIVVHHLLTADREFFPLFANADSARAVVAGDFSTHGS